MMKRKGLSLIVGLCCLISCTDTGIIEDMQEEDLSTSAQINNWVYDQMNQYYLWYDQLPKKASLDLEQEPSNFFAGLLVDADGKRGVRYSHMEYDESLISRSATSNGNLSYGFEYILGRIAGSSDLLAQILYVYRDSPAEQAGLKRGDLILAVDGESLNESNYYAYLSTPTSEARLSLGKVVFTNGFEAVGETTIPAPQVVEEHAVYKDTVLQIQGKKIAYLMYNKFDETDDDELHAAFKRFYEVQPDEFILDLRYNPGGNADCAQLLATLLAPQELFGQEFIHMQFNDKLDMQQEYTFDTQLLAPNENLNMHRLYVIATSQTASASEAVINGLKPYLGSNLIQVGETTFGKNVGQVLLENSKWSSLELWPTAFSIYNSEDYGAYESGLEPDIFYSEGLTLGELGTPEDPLTAVALAAIIGNDAGFLSTRTTEMPYEKIYTSVSRHPRLFYIP